MVMRRTYMYASTNCTIRSSHERDTPGHKSTYRRKCPAANLEVDLVDIVDENGRDGNDFG